MSLFAKRNDRATVSTLKSNVFIMDFWKKKVEGVRSLEKRNQSHIRDRLKLMGRYKSGNIRKCYSREVETEKLSVNFWYPLFSQFNNTV